MILMGNWQLYWADPAEQKRCDSIRQIQSGVRYLISGPTMSNIMISWHRQIELANDTCQQLCMYDIQKSVLVCSLASEFKPLKNAATYKWVKHIRKINHNTSSPKTPSCKVWNIFNDVQMLYHLLVMPTSSTGRTKGWSRLQYLKQLTCSTFRPRF